MTEIYDYFRLLYARIGIPHCPKCGREIRKQTVDQMVDQIMSHAGGNEDPAAGSGGPGHERVSTQKLLERAKRSGYVRVQVDGSVYELTEKIRLDKNKKHNIEIVVDRLVVKPGIEKRLTDSIENVLNLAEGLMTVDVIGGEPVQFSARAFPARTAGSALMRSSRAAFLSTIRSVPARNVTDWATRWSLTRI